MGVLNYTFLADFILLKFLVINFKNFITCLSVIFSAEDCHNL